MYYVYILQCKDQRTYLGCTNGLKERLERHQKGFIPATKQRLPVSLICYFAFHNKNTAFQFEKYLKTGSGRAFINKHFL
ncbi:MAG: GIY-YIG nuclease family protein [Minisyncoccales bacterium]